MSHTRKRSWSILLQTVTGASCSVFLFLTPSAPAIVDANNNTLSDLWEKHHNNGNLLPNLDPQADPDRDGWTNIDEAAAGTNPYDSNPPNGIIRPNIVHIPATYITGANGDPEIFTPEAITLTWPTLPGKQYTLHYSPDLSEGSWHPVEAPYIGNGSITEYGIPLTQENGSNPDKLFWRVAIGDIDTDGDSLSNYEESILGTNSNNSDTDFDGIVDNLDPLPSASATLADPDGANPPLGSAANLRGFWDFESQQSVGFPAIFPDRSGNNRHAISSGPGPQPLGMPSQAARIGSGYITIPPTTVQGQPTHTVSGWFKLAKDSIKTSNGTPRMIYALYDQTGTGPAPQYVPLSQGTVLYLRATVAGEEWFIGGYQRFAYYNQYPYSNGNPGSEFNGHYFIRPAGTSDDGQWHHFAATRSTASNGQKLYLDGKLVIQGALKEYPVAYDSNTTFTFGILYPGYAPTNLPDAHLDRLRVHSKLLTQSEITALYHQDIDRDGLWDITETSTRYSDYSSSVIIHPDPTNPNPPQPTQTGYARSPFLHSSSALDFDLDELNDLAEQTAGTNLTKPDTDDDNLTDGFEIFHNFNPLNAYSLGATGPRDDLGDPDSDTLTTLTEYLNGSNPRNSNSDGDGKNDAAEIAQGSDPANAADSGAAPTDPPEPVPLHINGDYTAWEATLKGKGPNDTRTRRFRMSAHNVAADQTLPLLRGNAYELSLRYIRTKPGESVPWYCWEASIAGKSTPAFTIADHWVVDNSSAVLATHTHSHGTNLVADKKVNLLPVEVAVDADRDGEITFDQKDKTTAEKPFRFWINDDRDIGHTVDRIAHPPGDWEEDDVNSDEQANPDCDVAGLKFRRDLEDLTRIWIDFAGINSVFPSSDSTVALKVRIDADSGTPKVNLFQPVESDGGREFLKDEATGYNQLQGIYGQELCKVTGSSSVEVPRRAWENLPADKVVHLLFEGAKEGDGKLIFELWKNGEKLCDLPPVILRLRKANDFYETWTVGDVTSPEITDDNNNYSVWPASSASMQPNTGRDLTTPEKPEEKDYIMFVHGWNMTPDDKTQFADTMFKRLWHQGFKGRFGAYRWPTFFTPSVEVNNFNGSEERAWSSAAPLAALLQNRSTIFNVGGSSRVRVFGHSMGNIVCSEALRSLWPTAPVHTYVSGQAALAAHCWDEANPRWMPYGVQWSNTANIYRGYWQSSAGGDAPHKWEADSRPPYMHSSYMPSGVKYVNHHNIDDWALDSWELNQKLKPAIGYHYGLVPGSALGSEHRFYKNLVSPTTLLCPGDRFQIFSWASEARSFATGAEPLTDGVFSEFVNLRAAPYNFDDKHKGHSAQFRSTIQKRWVYWSKFLDDCVVPYNP